MIARLVGFPVALLFFHDIRDSVRRKKTGDQPHGRGFDYLKEIDGPRLRLIGAITLAWNWIEWTLDTALALSLEAHPDMWLEITSRINGMEGKIELLKKSLGLSGYPPLEDGGDQLMRRFLGAVPFYKKLRDGIIHARLLDPADVIADTSQRRGVTDEVLFSEEALQQLYDHLTLLGREAEFALQMYFFRWRMNEDPDPFSDEKLKDGQRLQHATAQLRLHLQTREALPPLPEFPDPPPAPPDSEAPPEPGN